MFIQQPFLELLKTFPSVNREDWKKAALPETGEKNPDETLSWEAWKGSRFAPYYDAPSLDSLSYLQGFHFQPPQGLSPDPRHWANLPVVRVTNELQACQNALALLHNGAEGILFDVTGRNTLDPKTLLKDIEVTRFPIAFWNAEKEIIETVFRFLESPDIPPQAIPFHFYVKNFPVLEKEYLLNIPSLKNKLAFGLMVNDLNNPVLEIAEALKSSVDFMSQYGHETLFPLLGFSVIGNTNFFINIARLKTLRILWYALSSAYSINAYHPSYLHLHAMSPVWEKDTYQPHANLIQGPSMALASILGGCNALTLATAEENNMLQHLSISVPALLKEEAHLTHVADPLAGAYFIENFVHEMAQQAWKKFLTLV